MELSARINLTLRFPLALSSSTILTAFIKSVSSWSGVEMILDPRVAKYFMVESRIESKSPEIISGLYFGSSGK